MPNFSSIPNIVFDLGGVLLNINPENSVNQFKAIGLSDTTRIQHEYRENGLFDRLEKGLLSPEDFRNEIRQYIDAEVSDKQIDHAWNAMLLDFPHERLLLLKNLERHIEFSCSATPTVYIGNVIPRI